MNSGEFIELKDPNEGNNPTQDEIEEYASWLGADLEKDQDLFWIAREALTVSLPPGWKVYQRKDGTGEPFYFNSRTGESLWDHPLDAHFKELFLKEKAKKEEMAKAPASNRPQASLGNKIERKSEEQFEFQPNQQPVSIGNHSADENKATDDDKSKSGGSGTESTEEDEEEENNNNSEKIKKAKEAMDKELSEMRSKHDKEMEELRKKQGDEKKSLEALVKQLQDEKAKVQKEIDAVKNDRTAEKMKQENQKKIDEEVQRFNKEMKELKEKNAKAIDDEKKAHQKIMEQLKQDQQKQITEADLQKQANDNAHQMMTLKIQLEQQASDLKKQYKTELEDLTNQHQTNLANADQQYQRELARIQADNEQRKQFEMQKLQQDLRIIHENYNNQRQQLEQEAQRKQMQNEKIEIANKEELEQVKSKYESQIEKMKSEHQKELSDMISKYEEEIKDLNKKSNTEKSVSFASPDSGKQLKALSASFAAKKKDLEEQFEYEIETLNMQHEQEMNRLKRQQQKQISAKNQEINNLISKMNDEFENQKSELDLENQNEIDLILSKHKKAIQKLKKQNQSEIDSIKEEHEEELEHIQEDNKKQIDKLKQKHQKAMDKEKSDFEQQLQRLKDRNEQQLKNKEDFLSSTTNTLQSYLAQQQQLQQQQQQLLSQRQKPFLVRVNLPIFSEWPKSKRPLIASDLLYFCGSNRLPFFSIDEKIIFSAPPKPQTQQQPLSSSIPDPIPLSIPPQSISSRMDSRPQPIITSQSALGAPRSAFAMSPYELSLTPTTDDAMVYGRITKHKSKLSKINDQFENTCSEISDNMRTHSQDIISICHSFKSFISDQNREMSRISMDFQQQSAQMSRNISSTMATIESSYRDAISSLNSTRIAPPVIAKQPKSGRIVKYIAAESEDYESSEATDQWMYEPKTHLRRKTKPIE